MARNAYMAYHRFRETGTTLEAPYYRQPKHDRRIARGDDFAGDAWKHVVTGKLIWVAVGHNPNMQPNPVVSRR